MFDFDKAIADEAKRRAALTQEQRAAEDREGLGRKIGPGLVAWPNERTPDFVRGFNLGVKTERMRAANNGQHSTKK